MTDDIRVLSEALAADPASTAFLRLGELLRRRGELDLASQVATRGLARHPQRADAHDLVARIAADRGDAPRARAEWEFVLSLSPAHAGALKGLGFLCFSQGELESAERFLRAALSTDPDDQTVADALYTVRSAAAAARAAHAPPHPARAPEPQPAAVPAAGTGHGSAPTPSAADSMPYGSAFAALTGDGTHAVLLLDGDGYVLAGEFRDANGLDAGAAIGAQLSGVSDEASRVMRHLGLGSWHELVFETERSSVAMAPCGDGVLLVASPRATPLGLVRRVLVRARDAARTWLEGVA